MANDKLMRLTVAEKRWLEKLDKLLGECPTSRLEAYTCGDYRLYVYDSAFQGEIEQLVARGCHDFRGATDALGCNLMECVIPFNIHPVVVKQ